MSHKKKKAYYRWQWDGPTSHLVVYTTTPRVPSFDKICQEFGGFTVVPKRTSVTAQAMVRS